MRLRGRMAEDYCGPIDFYQSVSYAGPRGTVKADIFHAIHDARSPFRLAYCYGDGVFNGAAGRYFAFPSPDALLAHWTEVRQKGRLPQ